MPSTPTTKSQVQAYRFVLRRMESALVRKDPVMLHDPMRSHKRATIVGAIIGVVGLVVFLLIGAAQARRRRCRTSGIVIAQQSGAVYVVSQSPKELIPVFNVASGRLLLAAAAQQRQNQSGDGGSTPESAPSVVQPVTVDDSELDGRPFVATSRACRTARPCCRSSRAVRDHLGGVRQHPPGQQRTRPDGPAARRRPRWSSASRTSAPP